MIDVDNLDPETMYIVRDYDDSLLYVRTPDGVGCFWYDEDEREEAEGDVCDHKRVMHFDSNREFEDYRYRESNDGY